MTRADFYVYALFRENGAPFYIGKGTGRRWEQHKTRAIAGEEGHRFNIIRSMVARGFDVPKVKLHEGLTEAMAHEYEVSLIAAIGREPGGPLVNMTDGGEGVSGLSPEGYAKWLAANKGRKRSQEFRTRASMIQLGKRKSPEHVAKVAAVLRGRKLAAETIAKMSAARIGKRKSFEHRMKLAMAHLGMKHSPETKAKMSATRRGLHG
jgi:LEM-3-like GIY-YIG domain/NUMOD3 motif